MNISPSYVTRQDALIAQAYEDMYAKLLGYVMKRIGYDKVRDAEDICQETFLHLANHKVFLKAETLHRLIYTIARNLVTDWLRHHARTQLAQEFFFWHGTKSCNMTEEQMDAKDFEQLERQCLGRMPVYKAQAFILYVHAGRSVEEIADTMGLTVRSVENHIYRVRKELREIITKAG